jgi:hypothetical protein
MRGETLLAAFSFTRSVWVRVELWPADPATVCAERETDSTTAAGTDLDVPATITVKAASSKKNRHISSVTIALDADDLPTGCKAEWFTFSNGAATAANEISTAPAWTGHTFASTTEETVAGTSLGYHPCQRE